VKVFNETPFAFASIMGKVVFPENTITLIVKGTYSLSPGAPAALLPPEKQTPPGGDRHYEDDPHAPLRYESDFAYFKPRADVLLAGHCHVPEGRSAQACRVTLQAGTISKSLMVFGDRSWRRNRLGIREKSEPEPFKAMALRYENSFGGPGCGTNPVGRGHSIEGGPSETPEETIDPRLPNLERLDGDRVVPWHPGGIPAGFGPLGRTGSERMALSGSYSDQWKRDRWPWLPEDFDWGYFNAAPPDQQVQGYLQGNETLYLENMHPRHSQWRAWLPGTRVRCFVSENPEAGPWFREITMALDTLWVDMDDPTLVLIWRGVATVASSDAMEIDDLLIVQESLQEAPRPVEAYAELLHRRRAEDNAAAAAETEATLSGSAGEVEDLPTAVEDDAPAKRAQQESGLAAALQQALTQIHQGLNRLNLDPQAAAALGAEKDPGPLAEKVMELLGPPEDPQALEKIKRRAEQTFIETLAQCRPEAGRLLADMGRDTAMLEALEKNFAGGAKGRTAQPGRAPAKGAGRLRDQDLTGADFSGMVLEKTNFQSARLAGARFVRARLAGANFSQADLAGADFSGADLRGARFNFADLSQARFQNARMVGADLSDAVLIGANLREADLTKAHLLRAQLEQADLGGCVLKSADLEQADLSQARMPGANLTKARLAFAVLEGADLTRCVARQAVAPSGAFNQTVLTEADFSEAKLEESNFSNCRCDGAVFQGATLSRATFEGATGRRVNFRLACLDGLCAGEGVRLPEAVFMQASGAGANWAGADLRGAEFVAVAMPSSDFSQADLSGCNGRGADLRQALFDQTVLRQARFNEANLFQARLEAADLRGATFEGSNLYGAEFLNATMDNRSNFRAANLRGTKLAGRKSDA
jgi:uncharacterized protein YjbI with pentapeptide repeats